MVAAVWYVRLDVLCARRANVQICICPCAPGLKRSGCVGLLCPLQWAVFIMFRTSGWPWRVLAFRGTHAMTVEAPVALSRPPTVQFLTPNTMPSPPHAHLHTSATHQKKVSNMTKGRKDQPVGQAAGSGRRPICHDMPCCAIKYQYRWYPSPHGLHVPADGGAAWKIQLPFCSLCPKLAHPRRAQRSRCKPRSRGCRVSCGRHFPNPPHIPGSQVQVVKYVHTGWPVSKRRPIRVVRPPSSHCAPPN